MGSDPGLKGLFRDARYREMASRLAPAYAGATPFPHTIIDDFLPEAVASRVLEEFPLATTETWDRYDKSAYSKKLAANREEQVGPFIYSVLRELNGPDCLAFLGTLTGIRGLIPDPYFEGGGLHQILPGGFLKVHADFNRHSQLRLDRRLNLLVYLNRDWKEEYGGQLELWPKEMQRCAVRALPVFNRAVIFNTTDNAYHGHPDPLTCPEGMSRKSMALYYYSAGRPEEETAPSHSTLWQMRPRESRGRIGWARALRRVARGLQRLPDALRRAARSIDGLPPESGG
jgi:hypothetical protein